MDKELIGLLDSNLVKNKNINENTNCIVKTIRARDLLVPQRLDLMAKWIYIDAYTKNMELEYAKEVYGKHIQAFSMNSFSEPGNEEKNSLEKYFEVFNNLIDDISKNGFNSNISLVPVGKNNIILDGAHRTSIAAYFDQEINIVYFPDLEVNFDAEYFISRKLSKEIVDYMVLQYVKLKEKGVYFACLWPIGDNKEKNIDAVKLIPNKIYTSSVELEKKGIRNFMLQIYGKQEWVGTPANHYIGLNGKVNECYKPNLPFTIVLFEESSLDNVFSLKDKIRDIFMIGKHSIHISDTIEETLLMSELLLNQNSVHFLNNGNPDYDEKLVEKLTFKSGNIFKNIYDLNTTMLLYGVDDFKGKTNTYKFNEINPRNYFNFLNYRFMSLSYIQEHDSDASKKALELMKKDKRYISKQKRFFLDCKVYWQWKIENSILDLKIFVAGILKKIGLHNK